MTGQAELLLGQALLLSESERAELAAKLISSLDADPDEDVDDAWAVEIERRCAELDAGTAVTSDWETVRRRIEQDILRR